MAIATAAQACLVAFAVVLTAAGPVAALAPGAARRFLSAFAGSRRVHVLEQSVRLLVGVAAILAAPVASAPGPVRVLGWLLVATAAGLLALPWRVHRRFAERVLPPVVRHVRAYCAMVSAFGVLLLLAAA